MKFRVEAYLREDGSNPYEAWFEKLDPQAAAKVTTALVRLGMGKGQDPKQVTTMALTRDFKQTVIERVRRDPAFARALLDEAATLFLNGEPEPARIILRDLVNATVGFEELAALTAKPSKSLHRMLSPKGNPSMDNLAAIFGAVGHRLKVGLEVRTVEQP